MRPIARLAQVAALVTAAWAATPALAQMPGMGGPTQVGVIELEEARVPYSVTLPGRAVAFEETDIRPRVAGVISEIVYEPGTEVLVGDVLFRIEGDTFAADLAAAEATVASAEASVSAAETTLARYETLSGTGVTAETVENARVTLAQAEATLSSARAARDLAQLNLDRTEILSPIKGIADISNVSVGALVTANQTDALTTVTRINPIYVDVQESSRRIQLIRDRISAGTLAPGEELDVTLQLETGLSYEIPGSLVTGGTSVSTTTGTTIVRFQFDNPDQDILPGQFLRVDITLGDTPAILVPQRATSRAADGTLTAFVAVDGEAVERTLTETGVYQNAWIVTEGVADGDMLIVDGLTNLTAGAEVQTVPVTISADGVVSDLDTADASDGDADAEAPAADDAETPGEDG
ncbi:efflux RND transporter periplasmic adaptor subunit [Psychromarinibacter sp. S121]|uniref:efflux RND transporter periplasmic adaptor subunit n=1 Tax=Psychromarinibacter sp. S121 TaxID=3415127 RepID=UPI003C7BDB8F